MQPQIFQFHVDNNIEKLVYVSRLGRTTTVIVKFIDGATATEERFRLVSDRAPTLTTDSHGLVASYDRSFLGIPLGKRLRRY